MAVDKNVRILIVDDQEAMLEILREFLSQLGFRRVQKAMNATLALTKLREGADSDPYAMIFSDWNMAPVSGLQLLQAVRGDAKLKDTPFIMITGETTKDRVKAAIEAGVTGYLAKPLSLEAMKKRMTAVLGEF